MWDKTYNGPDKLHAAFQHFPTKPFTSTSVKSQDDHIDDDDYNDDDADYDDDDDADNHDDDDGDKIHGTVTVTLP